MHLPRTVRFDEEQAEYSLRFTCEDCGCFDVKSEQCRHGWPTEHHRRARYQLPRSDGSELIFCKEFEVR